MKAQCQKRYVCRYVNAECGVVDEQNVENHGEYKECVNLFW